VRKNPLIEWVSPDSAAVKQHRPGQNDIPGFYVNYTASNPQEAQQICTELTSMLLAENLKTREQVAQSTTDFLARQVDLAKHDLDNQDAKMAAFKKQYLGQLPGDEENTMKLLAGLNSQLDAYTQALNRAEQDRAYAQSLLSQQLAAWSSSQTSMNPENLQKQLADLQTQLISLQARYTDDHPDVVKTKNDIAELKRKMREIRTREARRNRRRLSNCDCRFISTINRLLRRRGSRSCCRIRSRLIKAGSRSAPAWKSSTRH
ncbi:MAG: hypothetical protein ABSC15_25030, partial [Terriglobales bacterium]